MMLKQDEEGTTQWRKEVTKEIANLGKCHLGSNTSRNVAANFSSNITKEINERESAIYIAWPDPKNCR